MSTAFAQVLAALNALQPPDPQAGGGRVFAAMQYPGSRFHRLGKDTAGHIAVLLALDPSAQDSPLPPMVLENLSVLHAAKCRIRNRDGHLESGLYTVVSCTSDDKSLVKHFVTLISSLVLSLPDRPSCQAAAAAIQRMIRLFRSLLKPSTRSIQGLWAELFVIRSAADAKAVVRAWRADPLEQFDFAESGDRLEVKSTKWARRSHQFSIAQVRPPPGLHVMVASLQVAPMANGLRLSQLWHEVRRRVEDDSSLLLRADEIVTTSLGRAWRRGLDVAFDETVARNTLAFFEATAIPSVDPQLPTEVTDVHFRSDLSAVPSLAATTVQLAGPLFHAATPNFFSVVPI